MLDLVREKRYLWDVKDPQYHRLKLRQDEFKRIVEALTLAHPDMGDLNGDELNYVYFNL